MCNRLSEIEERLTQPAGVEMASVQVDRWAIGDAFWPEDGSPPDGDQRAGVETD